MTYKQTYCEIWLLVQGFGVTIQWQQYHMYVVYRYTWLLSTPVSSFHPDTNVRLDFLGLRTKPNKRNSLFTGNFFFEVRHYLNWVLYRVHTYPAFRIIIIIFFTVHARRSNAIFNFLTLYAGSWSSEPLQCWKVTSNI